MIMRTLKFLTGTLGLILPLALTMTLPLVVLARSDALLAYGNAL